MKNNILTNIKFKLFQLIMGNPAKLTEREMIAIILMKEISSFRIICILVRTLIYRVLMIFIR